MGLLKKGLWKVAETELLETSRSNWLLMNKLDCVKWNGGSANDRELPESTNSCQVNENKQAAIAHSRMCSTIFHDRPKTQG